MNKSNVVKKTLYKYRKFNARTLSMFIDRELYFASPKNLNDPYDCKISMPASIQDAIKIAQTAHPASLPLPKINLLGNLMSASPEMESDLMSKGILSLSRTSESVLMWTHYADEHRGLCIGLKHSSNFLNSRENNKDLEAITCKYYLKNPFVNKLVEVVTANKPETLELLWQHLYSIGIAAKHSARKYEREVRIIRKKPGIERLQTQELVEIIFGAKMEKENIKTVLNLLAGKEWAHVKYSVMSKYVASFGLKKVPVSKSDIEKIRQGSFEMTSIF